MFFHMRVDYQGAIASPFAPRKISQNLLLASAKRYLKRASYLKTHKNAFLRFDYIENGLWCIKTLAKCTFIVLDWSKKQHLMRTKSKRNN